MPQNLGQPLANGRTAEIYAWQNGQVLKLFHNWILLEDIQYEQEIGQAIQPTGLPVPAVGDIIHVNERHGLLFQRVEGLPLLSLLARAPWRLFRYARQMAALHVAMHNSIVPTSIPSQRQKLAYKIGHAPALPPVLRERALAALATMPSGNRLCHGDFHPDNILVTAHEAVTIDWLDASLGNPLADVARTSIIFQGAVASSQIESRWQKTAVHLFHSHYLRHYFTLRPGGKAEYTRWRPIVAAARLSEGIVEVESWLLQQVEKGL